MQNLNQLLQVVNAASSVAEIVREKQVYRYGVRGVAALYLHTEGAEVRLFRWALPTIEISAQLQATFGWRIAQEQDDAGVYFVAKRRKLVGGLSAGVFTVTIPHDTHVILRLERCQVFVGEMTGVLELPGKKVMSDEE
jgi:hypothetical protein